ncbi:lactate/malate family dehydrogenase [Edaphobacter modestus]|uniref:Malate dehydrogenase n=2 Tax=Edaphobacter modestus TaxID=388466 RepID=A0A4V2G410_9BACT|nr:lactate dehydrogenase [Edaphobacter modestus]RZU39116.1 malate dehydrogenase [Edaphobacter modestus]
MAKTISIIGASGSVGSTLAAQILRSKLLGRGDRLQLVAHGVSSSSSKLLATRIDLMDAFDDDSVDIELVANIQDTEGDIVVMCAGAGLGGNLKDRRDLGKFNLPVFEEIAKLCAEVVPSSTFIIVSNPVELAVEIFAEKLGRERVIGMGAEQDSLRFARAIAHDLGLSRHEVFASVLGEHGQAMVPLWSSVKVETNDPTIVNSLAALIERSKEVPLAQRAAKLKSVVFELLQGEQIEEAYEVTRRALPDARIFAQPLITGHAIHSTPNATANATLRFLSATLGTDARPLHGQVVLVGELASIRGVCGVPLTVKRDGWELGTLSISSEEQLSQIRLSAASIANYLMAVRC